MTNLPGADLNAACSGPNGARLMDEPSNERSQRTCNLKYDGCSTQNFYLRFNRYRSAPCWKFSSLLAFLSC
ncbi:hypothetical protein EGD00_03985 [Pectobacterium carotovorum subsp. carotovorum]|nr:hypothetical protein EGD00_03985 [Pectobacterium carotovorum subsp. carotovorum]